MNRHKQGDKQMKIERRSKLKRDSDRELDKEVDGGKEHQKQDTKC